MPPGVEHAIQNEIPTNLRRLIIVSMPPGVEHIKQYARQPSSVQLIIVSMPPGVEHGTVRTSASCVGA